jgi:hypothetical protein
MVVGLVISVPEILAAAGFDLPWAALSKTMRHLEHNWPWTTYIAVAVIGIPAFFSRTVPLDLSELGQGQEPGSPLGRTPGGRVTIKPRVGKPPGYFDDEGAPLILMVVTCSLWALMGFATWLTLQLSDDPHHYDAAYVLYGVTAFFSFVVPSLVALLAGQDTPFPTYARTVQNTTMNVWTRGIPGVVTGLVFGYLVTTMGYILLRIVGAA